VPDLITQKQDRVAESQLQRAVMELLGIIQPTDGLAQSCLMSTLAEIAFSALWVQVPVTSLSAAALNAEDGDLLLRGGAGQQQEGDWLILGAAPDKLRKEAAEHLTQLLQLAQSQSAESGDATSTASKGSKLFSWASSAPSFVALVVDVVVRRFVADICEGPLLVRSAASVHCADATSGTDAGAPQKRPPAGEVVGEAGGSTGTAVGSGYFSSLSSIMSSFSSASAPSLQPVYPKHAAPPAAVSADPALASARIAGGTLHRFVKYVAGTEGRTEWPDCTPTALAIDGPGSQAQWRTFYSVESDVKLFLAALQTCCGLISAPQAEIRLQQPRAPGASPVKPTTIQQEAAALAGANEIVTEAVWNSILTATACLLSPWTVGELCAKDAARSNGSSGAADIAHVLLVSLKIVDFMR
jgi:hypothetical protein